MNFAQWLNLIRQYASVSQRMHYSFAPQVDEVTALYKAQGNDGAPLDEQAAAKTDAQLAREYNPLYRDYPTPPEKA